MESLQERVDAEPYWFHRMPLVDGVITPGWSDTVRDKLPYFGLPSDMTGMRVLDVGCAEGFFSFEAERRGAAEVISIDYDPECIKRFGICAEALQSKLELPREMSVYSLDPDELGTFDLVMFFGLLYHLEYPLLGVEKVASMTRGTLLIQSFSLETPHLEEIPLARFRPDGVWSGPPEAPIHDPTVFWEPNAACVRDMLKHVGLVNIEQLKGPPQGRRAVLAKRLRTSKAMTNSGVQFRAEQPK